MSPRPRSLKSRFDEKWTRDPQSGCWVWNGAITIHGYGKIFVSGKLKLAHRVAWELYIGRIPSIAVLDHKCRRKNCVNPDHLEAVTVGENTRRRNFDLKRPPVQFLRSTKRKFSLRERFDQKWTFDEATDCWNWIAQLNTKGYGNISKDGRPALAHRVSYELYIGPIPEGMHLDHLCRNARCVNPKHLEPVTNRENGRRGIVAEVNRERQLAKTHCKFGHPLSGDNLFVDKRTGQRVCRECRLARKRKFNSKFPKKPPNRDGLKLGGIANGKRQRSKTHCPAGHPYSGDNLMIDANTGYRKCKQCHREKARLRKK